MTLGLNFISLGRRTRLTSGPLGIQAQAENLKRRYPGHAVGCLLRATAGREARPARLSIVYGWGPEL